MKHRHTGVCYAKKGLEKAHVVRKNQVEHTEAERNVLAIVSHPFIVRETPRGLRRNTFQRVPGCQPGTIAGVAAGVAAVGGVFTVLTTYTYHHSPTF